MPEPPDAIVRAITKDGAFRVVATITTRTIRQIAEAQSVTGPTAEHLGDLVTGTVLVRATMAPQLRVQGILRGSKRSGTLVADSHPDGLTRGLVNRRGAEPFLLGTGSLLQMMRTLPSGQVQQGVIELSDTDDLSAGLMSYMQISEQVASIVVVATVATECQALGAGYMVQLLPEASRGMLMVMTERLEGIESLRSMVESRPLTAEGLIADLLDLMPYDVVDKGQIHFGCNCSQVRIVSDIASLPRCVIESLINEGRVLEVSCDFCGKEYAIHPGQLRGLLDQS